MTSSSMVRIYTKHGDDGTSGVLGGYRETKDHDVFEAVGRLDALTSSLGLAHAELEHWKTQNASLHKDLNYIKINALSTRIEEIMRVCFNIGAVVASPARLKKDFSKLFDIPNDDLAKSDDIRKYATIDARQLENEIDAMTQQLPDLTHFILPSGSIPSALLHQARVSARSFERQIIKVREAYLFGEDNHAVLDPILPNIPSEIFVYVNRLSDWIFTSARYVNMLLGQNDVLIV